MPRTETNISRFAILLAALLSLAPPAAHSAPDSNSPRRILFIGNSYTGQIKGLLTKFITASPHSETILEFITPGGRTLQQHHADPKTMARIQDGNWDIVVLQDQSQTPALFPARFEKAARDLHQPINESGAATAFYQTWGRRDGDKQNPDRFPDYPTMQKALTKAYATTARDLDATLIPVGEAWNAVRQADPALGRELYKNDGSHPSSKGAYLAACLFYAVLFGENPDTVAFDPGFDDEQAAQLRKAAWSTVSRD